MPPRLGSQRGRAPVLGGNSRRAIWASAEWPSVSPSSQGSQLAGRGHRDVAGAPDKTTDDAV